MHGNTWLDEASFDYLASPMTILKGRLFAFLLFAIYILVNQIYPLYSPIMILIFVLLMPWVVVRSIRFNALNTSYRGVTFNFKGKAWPAYLYFLIYPVLSIFTLGLALPAIIALQKRYLTSNSYYGTTKLDMDASIKAFYGIYLRAAAIVILAVVIMIAITATTANKQDPTFFIIASLLIYPICFTAYVYVQARSMNLVMNH